MWKPRLADAEGPRYVAIADALARDVATGTLGAGAQLPTQRELSRALGVTVGTVGRAYSEAERRGLISSHVGRGTFVRDEPALDALTASSGEVRALVDIRHELTSNLPPEPADDAVEPLLGEALRAIADSRQVRALLTYTPAAAGLPAHRDAGVAWVGALGLVAPRGRVLVCNGAHHALTVTLGALTRPGDVVLCEELTYPGFKAIARSAGVRLEPVALDAEGVLPEALDAACGEHQPRLFYAVPTIQNPTGSTLSPERRQAVAAVLRRHGVPLVEDDIHAALPPTATPPIAQLLPELSFYVASLAKALTPGLRIAYLVVPEEWEERIEGALWASVWNTPPLMAEIAARWIGDGTAARIVTARRREAEARQALARVLLGPHAFAGDPHGYHLWLPVPPPWRADELVAAARRYGLGINGPSTFFVGRGAAPHAVRACTGAASGRAALGEALAILRRLLDAGPEPVVGVA